MRTPLALCFVLLGAGIALGQDDLSGTYSLDGRYGWFGPKFDSTVTLNRNEDGTYAVTRSFTWKESGEQGPHLAGTGVAKRVRDDGRWITRIKVTFPANAGVADRVADAMGGTTVVHGDLSGTYKIKSNRRVTAWVKIPNNDGELKTVYESGRETDESRTAREEREANGENRDGTGENRDGTGENPDGTRDENGTEDPGTDRIKILSPQGAFLPGQSAEVRLDPEDAELEVVSGEATLADGKLVFDGAGEVQLRASHGGEQSKLAVVKVVEPEIIAVTVQEAIAIQDAPAPHFQRKLGQTEDAAWEPAAILKATKLKLSVTLAAEASLTQPVEVGIRAQGDDVRFEGRVELGALKGGQAIALESKKPLHKGVNVNALELAWQYKLEDDKRELGDTKLRVYTVHGTPVDNPLPRYAPSTRQGHPLNTKLHFELACTWAQGATQNIGTGDSIAHKIDNAMRHHVAWKDYGSNVPEIPHYPEGTKPPKNYADLPGSVSRGKRGIGQLFYPPLEPKKPYDDYAHYRSNFGWWLLDNPEYTGGRCNQQASLICDLVGTVGLEAEVYYIERWARGKTSGRPMRRFYKSSRSNKSWNFHGQAKVKLDDGTFWLYDGSGSWAPNRINGLVGDLMKVPGPYIDRWNVWKYEDTNWYVPMADWPDTWRGVPLQPGETALDPTAADGTYSQRLGSGKTDGDNKRHTFYAVNVGGRFLAKLDAGTVDAETYDRTKHGKIEDWRN